MKKSIRKIGKNRSNRRLASKMGAALILVSMATINSTMLKPNTTSKPGINIGLIAPQATSRVIPGDSDIIGNDFAHNSLPLQITRNSYNIPRKLPYYLFCPDALSTNYATVAQNAGTFPQGATLSVSIFQNNALRLTWTIGGATDTIDITTQFPVPYPVILAMIQSGDWFVSRGFQQTVGSNYNSQFNGVSLAFGQLSFSGFVGNNAIPLSNAKSPFQYQPNIIAVNRMITINTRRYLSMEMAATAPNPGDEIVLNDFDISIYHSGVDFTGMVVSSAKTDYVGGGPSGE